MHKLKRMVVGQIIKFEERVSLKLLKVKKIGY